LFLEGTRAALEPVTAELTAFTIRARTARGIDLTLPPFLAHRRAIASPTRYGATQALGAAMRAAGVELFRYSSARDREGGTNIGVLTPSVVGTAKPRGFETWSCTATRERVEFTKRDYFARGAFVFGRAEFLVGGVLPKPAV
jgi:hypothetical protein